MTNIKAASPRASAPAPRPARRAKFIAVANMKGGVGKTTTVVGLAEFLAIEKKASVLVVDLDQQASASLCIVGDSLLNQIMQQDKTIDAYIRRRIIEQVEAPLASSIRRGTCSVTNGRHPVFTNLLPASPQLREAERDILIELTKRQLKFSDILIFLADFFRKDFAKLRADFDYVLFDCAPGISPLTETAINASDVVIVPTIPDRISAFGLLAFMENVVKKSASLATVAETRILFTRVQDNVRLQKEVREALRQKKNFNILATEIAQNATLAAGIFPADLPVGAAPFIPTLNQKYGNLAIEQFKALVKELEG